jgi:phenylpropionate dioxygenase-like ring-hydroxylating dioxygenase large terminal subunit
MTFREKAPPDYDELVQSRRVHRSIYTEPAIFAEEMTKIFGATWVYLAHESQIASPNDYVTTRLGLRPIIVTRDKDGVIGAMINRCAHRASPVCQDEHGNTKRFTCPYHGWTYSNTGALVNVPFEEGYGGELDHDSHGLGRLPRVASFRGLIFGTLNAEAPELDEYLGEPAMDRVAEWVDRSPEGEIVVRAYPHRMVYRGNWKLAWDNAGDGLHPTFVHRSFIEMSQRRYGGGKVLSGFGQDPDKTPMFGQDLGRGHIFVDQRPSMTNGFWKAQRPMPGAEHYENSLRERVGDAADDALEIAPTSGVNLSIFPNLLILGNQLQIVEPFAVDHTRLTFWVCAAKGAPDEVNIMRMRIGEDFPTMGNPDDLEIYERCHEGLNIPEMEWIDTSKGLRPGGETVDERGVITSAVTSDTPIRGYLKEWRRLMNLEPKLGVV